MCPSPDNTDVREDGKLRVLVVDDEPTLRLGFAYALSSRTTTVETAATGRIALERLSETRFDVMILDLRMPDLDGIGVIESLRNAGNDVPVILCSAALSPAAALRAIRNRVVDFLLKPVRPSDLRQVVEFVLSPEQQPLPQAMKAMRAGLTDDAIRILESPEVPGMQTADWLRVLKSLRDTGLDSTAMEETLRICLPSLAFNSPAAGSAPT